MAGDNHHFVPRFLQKWFAIPKTSRKEIWLFKSGSLPSRERTKDVGADLHFYTEAVDREITGLESPLALRVAATRNLEIGSPVDAVEAAEIVAHFAPRTAHFRSSLERGLALLASHATTIFTDRKAVQSLIGLDEDEPTDRFREKFGATLDTLPQSVLDQLPRALWERIIFFLGKEGFESEFGGALPVFRKMLEGWISKAAKHTRDAHNKALGTLLAPDSSNQRKMFLETLTWSIAVAPSSGAILPDCVVIAVTDNGDTASLMLADIDKVSFVVMPLSEDRLLIGAKANVPLPLTFAFNVEAARCSFDFFFASSDNPEIAALVPMIGERSKRVVDETLENVVAEYLPKKPGSEADDNHLRRAAQPASDVKGNDGQWTYELSLLGWERDTSEIQSRVSTIVAELTKMLPLQRLDGITIARDYAGALAQIDSGFPNASPPSTVGPEVGVGVGQTVMLLRDDVVKGRIVVAEMVGLGLVNEDPIQVDWAVHRLVRELSEVALMEIMEHALPDIHRTPLGGGVRSFLYGSVDAAIHGYLGSFLSAGFGDPATNVTGTRQLATEALLRMRSKILEARFTYRYHGDLDAFMQIALSEVRLTLMFVGNLCGYCDALGTSPFDDDGGFEAALQETGLVNWLPMFQQDLERFRERLGKWASLDEFLSFSRHIERLLWQHGIFPWDGEGGPQIHIPLASDAAALMAAEAAAEI